MIVTGSLGIVPKIFEEALEELEIGGQIEFIQTMALLRLARILKESRKPKETCRHEYSSERPSVSGGIPYFSQEV